MLFTQQTDSSTVTDYAHLQKGGLMNKNSLYALTPTMLLRLYLPPPLTAQSQEWDKRSSRDRILWMISRRITAAEQHGGEAYEYYMHTEHLPVAKYGLCVSWMFRSLILQRQFCFALVASLSACFTTTCLTLTDQYIIRIRASSLHYLFQRSVQSVVFWLIRWMLTEWTSLEKIPISCFNYAPR